MYVYRKFLINELSIKQQEQQQSQSLASLDHCIIWIMMSIQLNPCHPLSIEPACWWWWWMSSGHRRKKNLGPNYPLAAFCLRGTAAYASMHHTRSRVSRRLSRSIAANQAQTGGRTMEDGEMPPGQKLQHLWLHCLILAHRFFFWEKQYLVHIFFWGHQFFSPLSLR